MAPRTAKTDSAPKMVSRRVLVNIRRDQTTETPRVVWQHELPILEEIFGEGNVIHVDPSSLDEGYSPRIARELLIYNKEQDRVPPPSEGAALGHVFIGSPAMEYQRLAAAYGMHPEVSMSNVEKVYGRFQDGRFSDVIGSPTLDDLPETQLRQLLTDYVGPDAARGAKAEDLPRLAAEAGVAVEA
jgi:hypothetical protein